MNNDALLVIIAVLHMSNAELIGC